MPLSTRTPAPFVSRPARRGWQRPLATLLAALIALPALPLQAQVRLPALGEAASDDLSVSAEKRVGEQIMREGRRDPTYLDDPVLLDYLQSVWQPLVAAARRRGEIDADTDRAFAWEAFLVRERSVNAFAMPGGYVGVHLGLIAITTTRDQLASVLAHELTHVTQRHIARSVASSRNASLVGLAAVILGVLAASRGGSPDAANAAIVGGQAAAIQGQLNFSRDLEREADRIGFGVLGNAGFATVGMAEMFERLAVATRLNDTGGFPYLRSHPLTVDRISEARSRTLVPGSVGASPPVMHALMQARARVLMDPSVQGLQRLADGATSSTLPQDRLGADYASALAATLMKDPARLAAADPTVTKALRQLAAAAPREPQAERALHLLRAEVLLARGDGAAATQALVGLPAVAGLGASARPLLLLHASAATAWHRQQPDAAASELRRGTEDLQTWLTDHPQDAAAWELLAGSADAGGLRLRSLRAGAEARAAVGDINGAIDRLRSAQASSRSVAGQDFIEASVIDARLRQLQAERRAIALEARGEGTRGRGSSDESAPPPPPPPTPTTPPR